MDFKDYKLEEQILLLDAERDTKQRIANDRMQAMKGQVGDFRPEVK